MQQQQNGMIGMIYGGMSAVHAFSYYQTREDYLRKVGEAPPPFDPTRPVKSWRDPGVPATQTRPVKYTALVFNDTGDGVLANPDSTAMTDIMLVDAAFARVVNIPAGKGPGEVSQAEGTGEVAMPLLPIPADMALRFVVFGGVKLEPKNPPANVVDGFTASDRAALARIEAILAKHV